MAVRTSPAACLSRGVTRSLPSECRAPRDNCGGGQFVRSSIPSAYSGGDLGTKKGMWVENLSGRKETLAPAVCDGMPAATHSGAQTGRRAGEGQARRLDLSGRFGVVIGPSVARHAGADGLHCNPPAAAPRSIRGPFRRNPLAARGLFRCTPAPQPILSPQQRVPVPLLGPVHDSAVAPDGILCILFVYRCRHPPRPLLKSLRHGPSPHSPTDAAATSVD